MLAERRVHAVADHGEASDGEQRGEGSLQGATPWGGPGPP
ncbi:hypothetical protein FM106_04790 [Brachybacterium faecium]|nr:hypothetical protein FM106_04790 [Brachybacterium faecium]